MVLRARGCCLILLQQEGAEGPCMQESVRVPADAQPMLVLLCMLC